MRLGDIDVAYADHGSGPPVVLVHGLAEDRGSWPQAQRELPGRRTVAYDLRGHGETGLGAADGTLTQLGGDLVALLEGLTGPAACVGFSLGGTVVLRAAVDRPDLVTRAVVLGTSSVVGRAAVGFYEQRIALVQSGNAGAVRAALHDDTAAAVVQADAETVDAVVDQRVAAVGGGAGYVNAARAMAGLRESPLTPELGRVRCHVDVIGADGDAFCPRKAADILLDSLPDAGYHEVAGAGHLMNVDRPESVTELLRRLLDLREAS
ncbi:MAG: alpha/beta fold hydrolase [Streptosporangiales bacterium]|nr:alpha/beta fold hydrolase [Streptosporangiales bacterium]